MKTPLHARRVPRFFMATLVATISLFPSHPVAAGSEPLALALYYPWYNYDTWSDPVLSDVPQIQYHGTDLETITRHVEWSKEAGIDVLVSAWLGPSGGNPTETGFRELLDTTQAKGLRAAIFLETDNRDFFPSLDAQRDALSYALNVHAQHPAYLRQDGRPVIFVWRPRGIWTGGQQATRDSAATVAAWQQLRDEVDPNHGALWIAETDSPQYLDVFDGLFFYNVAGIGNPGGVMARTGATVRNFAFNTGTEKVWCATAMPGYDDTGMTDRPNRFAVDRADGDFYRRTFDAAVSSSPDWIMIVSFNEWAEGHQIEPSVAYGDLYLDLTEELIDSWKEP